MDKLITAADFLLINPQTAKNLAGWEFYWNITENGIKCSDTPTSILEAIASNFLEFKSLVPDEVFPEIVQRNDLGFIVAPVASWWIFAQVAEIHKEKRIYQDPPHNTYPQSYFLEF